MEEFFVVCDNIRSLENIGSVFRTSDALGVAKIYLCGISGKMPGWQDKKDFMQKISKTALGAEKTVPFEYCSQTWRLIERLKKSKIKVVALEQDKRAVEYGRFEPKFPLALVIGNELKGVSKKVLDQADKIIFLPMVGKKESLNVSVAYGIAGYEINKHIK